MKALSPILPITVIVGGAIWISFLQNSLAELNALTQLIEERINLITPAVSVPAENEPEEQFLQNDGSLNWALFEELASRHNTRYSEADILVSDLVINRQVSNLSTEHLKQALTELETLELPDRIKSRIEWAFSSHLAQRNPLQILNSVGQHHWRNPGSSGYKQLILAFGAYARAEPTSATEWLDEQIRTGSLKSKSLLKKSETRLQLEFILLPYLAKENYARAEIRLYNLTETEREQLFSRPMYFRENHPELLVLARESLPEKSATRIIVNAYTPFYSGRDSLARTEKSLKTFPFSEDEKTAILHQAIASIIRVDSNLEATMTAYDFVKELAGQEASSLVVERLAHLAPHDLKKFYSLTHSLASEIKSESLIPIFIHHLPLSREDLSKRLLHISDPSFAEKILAHYDLLRE